MNRVKVHHLDLVTHRLEHLLHLDTVRDDVSVSKVGHGGMALDENLINPVKDGTEGLDRHGAHLRALDVNLAKVHLVQIVLV